MNPLNNGIGPTVFRQAGLAFQYMDHVSQQRGTKAMVLSGDLNSSTAVSCIRVYKNRKTEWSRKTEGQGENKAGRHG